MVTVFGILTIVFMISAIVFGFKASYEEKGGSFIAMIVSLLLFAVCAALFSGNATKDVAYIPKEFSAKDYTLEYKVTEFQEQKDTTYVITKIRKN